MMPATYFLLYFFSKTKKNIQNSYVFLNVFMYFFFISLVKSIKTSFLKNVMTEPNVSDDACYTSLTRFLVKPRKTFQNHVNIMCICITFL